MLRTESAGAAASATDAERPSGLRVVDTAPDATVSTSEMSRLTGVGRERLRTWERRHGFPTPVRGENGVRRYRVSDARAIATVARLVDRGMPLKRAIERTLANEVQAAADLRDAFGPALEHASVPMLALSGPALLRVVWTNAETAKIPEAPSPGDLIVDAVPHISAVAVSQLQRLLSAPDGSCVVIDHPDWRSSFPSPRRSIAWRLSCEATPEPIVVLAQLPDERPILPPHGDIGVWSSATAAACNVLSERSGLSNVQRALAEFSKETGATDAFLAISHGGILRAATSVRGMFAARDLPLHFADPALAAVASGQIDWLSGEANRILGAPLRSATLAIPMMGGGALIGAIFITFSQELALGDVSRHQLKSLALVLTLALQREQLAQRALTPQRPGALAA